MNDSKHRSNFRKGGGSCFARHSRCASKCSQTDNNRSAVGDGERVIALFQGAYLVESGVGDGLRGEQLRGSRGRQQRGYGVRPGSGAIRIASHTVLHGDVAVWGEGVLVLRVGQRAGEVFGRRGDQAVETVVCVEFLQAKSCVGAFREVARGGPFIFLVEDAS